MKLKKAVKNRDNTPSYPPYQGLKKEGRKVLKEIAVAVATIAATGTVAGTILTGCGDGESHRTAGVAPISGSVDPSALTTSNAANCSTTHPATWIGQSTKIDKPTDIKVKLGGKPAQPVEPRLRGDIASVAMPVEHSMPGEMVQPRSPVISDIEVRTGGIVAPPLMTKQQSPVPSNTTDK